MKAVTEVQKKRIAKGFLDIFGIYYTNQRIHACRSAIHMLRDPEMLYYRCLIMNFAGYYSAWFLETF